MFWTSVKKSFPVILNTFKVLKGIATYIYKFLFSAGNHK